MAKQSSVKSVNFNIYGLLVFLGLNVVAPITIENFWNKKTFKEEYYHYLDEELDGMKGFELNYY